MAAFLHIAWNLLYSAALAVCFAALALGLARNLFAEIRPFLPWIIVGDLLVEALRYGHVTPISVALHAVGALLWAASRRDDDDRWKRRRKRLTEKITRAGSRLTVTPATDRP